MEKVNCVNIILKEFYLITSNGIITQRVFEEKESHKSRTTSSCINIYPLCRLQLHYLTGN